MPFTEALMRALWIALTQSRPGDQESYLDNGASLAGVRRPVPDDGVPGRSVTGPYGLITARCHDGEVVEVRGDTALIEASEVGQLRAEIRAVLHAVATLSPQRLGAVRE